MGNAKPEIAQHANEQTLHVKNDGVAEWLEKNLIKQKGSK
jgi:hydroxymethylpyrimidine pyrophosphatase-like HAD family hydrolase